MKIYLPNVRRLNIQPHDCTDELWVSIEYHCKTKKCGFDENGFWMDVHVPEVEELQFRLEKMQHDRSITDHYQCR